MSSLELFYTGKCTDLLRALEVVFASECETQSHLFSNAILNSTRVEQRYWLDS